MTLVVLFGSLWRELGCLERLWLSFLDSYGPHLVTRCRPGAPGLIKELKEQFQAFVGGQCVQTICFTARSAFLLFITVHTFVMAGVLLRPHFGMRAGGQDDR